MTPPSHEESELYYYGLPSCPKLIARSSTHIWQNPQRPGFTTFTGTLNMYPKLLRPVGKHPQLHRLWNNATSSLGVQILQAVSGTDWTAIDILRVGLNDEFHITFLIAVKPDTLSWHRAHTLTLRCKAILEEEGIHDVHCEIRESVVTLLPEVSPTAESTVVANAAIDFQLSSMPITGPNKDVQADLSDCLGTKIAMKHRDSVTGTKGLYLALSPSFPAEGEPKIVALTRRHVVIDAKTEGTQMYLQQSGHVNEVIQIDQPTYGNVLEYLASDASCFRQFTRRATEGSDTATAAKYNNLANNTMALIRTMKPYETSPSRVFGRLLYSPEFACIPSKSGATWLRDWALIELLPNHHQAQLHLLKNKVYVGPQERFSSLVKYDKKGWQGLLLPSPRYTVNCTITLQKDIVPMGELLNPVHSTDYDLEPLALFVAKYGARGGLTLGLGNTLISVVRHTETLEGDRECISQEWAITSANMVYNRQAAFSEAGDSGSCVWDMKERPAGILMAGNGMNKINDITYAQPLERLLADIPPHGFDVSLV